MIKAALFLIVLSFGAGVFATEEIKGFDTDEEARFKSVTVPVGMVQCARDLSEKIDNKKAHLARKKYFDKVVAIGLSPNEMKNLSVETGDLLEVQAGDLKTLASVYKVTGDASPPKATINLSVLAAQKLQVKPGDKVEIHRPGDESLPVVIEKPTETDPTTRTEQSHL